VCEVQVDVCHAKLDIKLRDLLAQEQQVLDHKELPIQRPRLLCHQAPGSLQASSSSSSNTNSHAEQQAHKRSPAACKQSSSSSNSSCNRQAKQ
jgi:hypothetical protein